MRQIHAVTRYASPSFRKLKGKRRYCPTTPVPLDLNLASRKPVLSLRHAKSYNSKRSHPKSNMVKSAVILNS